jgi:CRP/FNR family transcriptional regulator, cyclic AMP receptor protein
MGDGSMEKRISLLQETALFRNLTSVEIGKVLKIAREVEFVQDDIVMREGDFGDTLYIIQKGTVEVAKCLTMEGMDVDDNATEANKVFTRLDASQHAVFGEIALLEETRRTATIRAVTDCVLLEIRKDDFLQLAEEDNRLGYQILLNLAQIVSARLRRADEDTIKLTTALSIILKES